MVPVSAVQERESSSHEGASLSELTDEQLLERYVASREEAAFAVILSRHGPLVYRVCRRTLNTTSDAEDAFQVTFLVLVKKADTIRNPSHLSSWLYGVAHRTALKVKARAARRGEAERHANNMPTDRDLNSMTYQELCAILHEEIGRLPEKYQAPIVLCYLEGKTNADAAQQLGWPEGSMSRRMARGRELLRSRLLRRGLTLPSLLTATLISQSDVSSVPPLLAASTFRAATLLARGISVEELVSPEIAQLVKESLLLSRLQLPRRVSVALLLTVGLLAVPVLLWYFGISAAEVLRPYVRSPGIALPRLGVHANAMGSLAPDSGAPGAATHAQEPGAVGVPSGCCMSSGSPAPAPN